MLQPVAVIVRLSCVMLVLQLKSHIVSSHPSIPSEKWPISSQARLLSDDAAFQALEQQLASAGEKLQQTLMGNKSASLDGNKGIQLLLSSMLHKVSQMGLWVTDTASEARLSRVQKIFETIKSTDGDCVISSAIRFITPNSTADGDDKDMLVQVVKGLLGLGLEHDRENTKGQRPSHWCSIKGVFKCAQALLPCRPDLAAEDSYGRTLLVHQSTGPISSADVGKTVKISCKDAAQLKQLQTTNHGGYDTNMAATLGKTGIITAVHGNGNTRRVEVKVGDASRSWTYNPAALILVTPTPSVWARAMAVGELEFRHATLAQLACKEQWWAVKSLYRRRAIPELEHHAKYHDRSAIGWADYHGQVHLAEELRYYLLNGSEEPQEKKGKEISARKDEATFGDMDLLKERLESVALCMGRFTENKGSAEKNVEKIESLQEELASLKKELSALNQTMNKKLTTMQESFEQQDTANKRDAENLRQELKNWLKQSLEEQTVGLREQLKEMLPSVITATINAAMAGYDAAGYDAAGNKKASDT